MIYKVPKKLIDTICQHLIDQYLPAKKKKQKRDLEFNDRDLNFFAQGAGALSLSFTAGRKTLPLNYLNRPEYRAGYILYFTVTNYLKALFCLGEIDANNRFGTDVNVLDIGTGPGTALLACLDHFKKGFSLTGIDQNKHILRDASQLTKTYANASIRTISDQISSKNARRILGSKRYDIVFFSNILGEIKSAEEQLALVETIYKDHLTQNGAIIIIEPALQKTTRALMCLRDRLCTDLDCNILSPCLHNAPCPMLLANHRDWCHMYLEWERPRLIEKIDQLIGNRKDYLKFSYLIMSPFALRAPLTRTAWRVVSSPLRSNGKAELLICNAQGLIRLARLDRDKSQANRVFDDLQRGNLMEYNGPTRLTKDSIIVKR